MCSRENYAKKLIVQGELRRYSIHKRRKILYKVIVLVVLLFHFFGCKIDFYDVNRNSGAAASPEKKLEPGAWNVAYEGARARSWRVGGIRLMLKSYKTWGAEHWRTWGARLPQAPPVATPLCGPIEPHAALGNGKLRTWAAVWSLVRRSAAS